MKKISLVLIIVSLGLIGVGVYLKSDNGKSNVEKSDSSQNARELDSGEYSNYYTDIADKVSYLNNYLAFAFPVDDVNNFSKANKTLFAVMSRCDYANKEVSLKKVKTTLKKYFGDDDVFLGDLKRDDVLLYQYVKSQEKFIYKNSSDLELLPYGVMVSSEGYNTKWIVKEKLAFIKTVIKDGGYERIVFSSYDDYKNNQNVVTSYTGVDNEIMVSSVYEVIKDKLKTVTFSFLKKNGEYVIDSIKYE